jgi:hypothetical protein
VTVADFADLECEASAKSVAVCATREQQRLRVTVHRQEEGFHEKRGVTDRAVKALQRIQRGGISYAGT